MDLDEVIMPSPIEFPPVNGLGWRGYCCQGRWRRPIKPNLRNWAKEYLSAITRIYFSLVDCPNNINKYSNIEGCL